MGLCKQDFEELVKKKLIKLKGFFFALKENQELLTGFNL